MKPGAAVKKVAILGGLLLVAAVIFCFDYFSADFSSPPPPKSHQMASAKSAAAPAAPARRPDARSAEFTPRQGTEPGEDKPDPATIDTTLRVDLLAKLHQVEVSAAIRNIFQYQAAPLSTTRADHGAGASTGTSDLRNAALSPVSPADETTREMSPFKYYGYKVSISDGRKQAFLLDGENITIAGENDAVKSGRYKVVRIGMGFITIEDLQLRREQTLPLEPAADV